MDRLARDILARLPLAEAVLLVWSHLADETFLTDLFEDHRGRCYQKVLTFPVLVSLIADALLEHGGSGRQSFERAAEEGQLQASIQAAYGKLGRIPIPLSEALLAYGTERLRALLPGSTPSPVPESLRGFSVVVLDGKAIKKVAKRLKPLRGVTGGVLGGKALVATEVKVIPRVAVLPSVGSDVPPGCGGRNRDYQGASSVIVGGCTSWRGPSAIGRSTPNPAVPSTAR
jgi:hypothetical protein